MTTGISGEPGPRSLRIWPLLARQNSERAKEQLQINRNPPGGLSCWLMLLSRIDSRAAHARILLPAALASMPFEFVLASVRVNALKISFGLFLRCFVWLLFRARGSGSCGTERNNEIFCTYGKYHVEHGKKLREITEVLLNRLKNVILAATSSK